MHVMILPMINPHMEVSPEAMSQLAERAVGIPMMLHTVDPPRVVGKCTSAQVVDGGVLLEIEMLEAPC